MTNTEKLLGVLMLLLFILYGVAIVELKEIRGYFDSFGNEPDISKQYSYIKDFMDRNLIYFSLLITILYAIVSILVGLALRYDLKRSIKNLKSEVEQEIVAVYEKFNSLSEDQITRSNIQDNSIKSAFNNIAIAFSTLADNNERNGMPYITMVQRLHSLWIYMVGGSASIVIVQKDLRKIKESISLIEHVNDDLRETYKERIIELMKKDNTPSEIVVEMAQLIVLIDSIPTTASA